MNRRAVKQFLRRLSIILEHVGVDARRVRWALSGLPRYCFDLARYARESSDDRFPLRMRELLPIFKDRQAPAGEARGGYFHQDLWAARRIHAMRPKRHVDVGSRIDGFIAHVLTFMPVELVDIRPLDSKVEGLTFLRGDATSLSDFPDDSVESLSTLHAVEHFGLGRYGDPLRPDAWREAILTLQRVLAPGGRLYFSVPIGRERLRFNAHRIFSPRTILETFDGLELVSFSAVNDAGDLEPNTDSDRFLDAYFSVGLFELTKRSTAPLATPR